jgi:hypothetical protein
MSASAIGLKKPMLCRIPRNPLASARHPSLGSFASAGGARVLQSIGRGEPPIRLPVGRTQYEYDAVGATATGE